MKALKYYLLIIIFLIFVHWGCDNPVQTEQKVDSWNNFVLSSNSDFCGPLACSPDGETLAVNRKRNLTFILSHNIFDNSTTIPDTNYVIENPLNKRPYFITISPDGVNISYLYKYRLENTKIIMEDLIIENMNTGEKQSYNNSRGELSYLQWSLDGTELYYMNGWRQIESLNISTGQQIVYDIDYPVYFYEFQLVPGKKSFLYDESYFGQDDRYYRIFEMDLETGEKRTILDTTRAKITDYFISPNGNHLVWTECDSMNVYTIKYMKMDQGDVIPTNISMRGIADLQWTVDNQTILFWAEPFAWTSPENGYWSFSIADQSLKFLYHCSYTRDYIMHPVENKYYTASTDEFYGISTISMDSVVTDYTMDFHHSPMFINWDNHGDIYYNFNGLYKLSAPDRKSERILPELSSSGDFDFSSDGNYLAFDDGDILIYDLINNQQIAFIENSNSPSWSPDASKLICCDQFDSVYVYEKQGDEFVKARSCYVEQVYAVDWAKTEIESDMGIVCCAIDMEQYYNGNSAYKLILLDEKLKELQIIAESDEKIRACWMANGLDVAFIDEDNKLVLKRMVSDF